MSAITSDNIWKESATRATELVIYPTTISTTKKVVVSVNMLIRRHLLPEYLPMVTLSETTGKGKTIHKIVIKKYTINSQRM